MNDRIDMSLDEIIQQDRRERFGETDQAWKCPNLHCNYWHFRRSWHRSHCRLQQRPRRYQSRPSHAVCRCHRDQAECRDVADWSDSEPEPAKLVAETYFPSHFKVTITNMKCRQRTLKCCNRRTSGEKTFYQNNALLKSAKRTTVKPIESEEKDENYEEVEEIAQPMPVKKYMTLNERFGGASTSKTPMDVDI